MLKHINTYVVNVSKGTFNRIVLILKSCGARMSLRLFTFLYSRSWTGVQYVVHEEAKRIGRQLLKSWLTYHRIAHCARCLEIGVQLRKTIVTDNDQTVYLCEKCLKSGEAIGAAKPALEIIKP